MEKPGAVNGTNRPRPWKCTRVQHLVNINFPQKLGENRGITGSWGAAFALQIELENAHYMYRGEEGYCRRLRKCERFPIDFLPIRGTNMKEASRFRNFNFKNLNSSA